MIRQQTHPIDKVLFERLGGLILAGKHNEHEGAACALEAASIARGRGISDKPGDAGLPTLWPISDGLCIWPDDQTRTQHVVPLVKALWGWPRWSKRRRAAWKRRVIQRTIQEILPCVLRSIGLEAEATRCAQEGTVEAADAASAAADERVTAARRATDSFRILGAIRAREAAGFVVKAARDRDDFDIAYAAYNVAFAVGSIARSHAATESDSDGTDSATAGISATDVLSLACRIWREEAERIHGPNFNKGRLYLIFAPHRGGLPFDRLKARPVRDTGANGRAKSTHCRVRVRSC